jgi:hypothetical protein
MVRRRGSVPVRRNKAGRMVAELTARANRRVVPGHKDDRRNRGWASGVAALPSALRHGVDFLVGGKAAQRALGESGPAVHRDLENPAAALDEFDLVPGRLKPIPRTEGARFVVSGHAIFDADFHGASSEVFPISSVLG